MAQLYETVVGGLKWTPGVFWQATISEVFKAIDGHNKANRAGPEPLTMEELDDLIERFPD